MGVTVVCADAVRARSLVRKVLQAERLGAPVDADVEVVAAGTPEAVVPATHPRVVLTPRATASEAVVALERGALAYLVDDDERRLADALATVARGRLWLGPETAVACLAVVRMRGDVDDDEERVLLVSALELVTSGWPWDRVTAELERDPDVLADEVARVCGRPPADRGRPPETPAGDP